jgi:hypothetical protein
MAIHLEKTINSPVLRLLINADILARDKNSNPILLADVRTQTIHPQVSTKMIDSLVQANGSIPFAMLVNPEKISIFKWGRDNWQEPICVFNTVDVLSQYEPEFGKKRIFHTYLTSLVEAWLRDLAYHWHSQHPPFWEEIKSIGLLEKLADGTTEEDVDIVEVNI